ncbi:hypothetical protein MMC13_000777 [Lambiella insularis]|nr:hypothetical protein [Lambiella insularis]
MLLPSIFANNLYARELQVPKRKVSLQVLVSEARILTPVLSIIDRKPVDPPPIIQLHVRDASDPAQNYLQSPYFFMCCSLWDLEENKHVQQDSSAVLAGTVVSSLHRLKDIDNTDGGFFVFGDLSVKVEGEYRLRFSLFEMFKKRPAPSTSRSDEYPQQFPQAIRQEPLTLSAQPQYVPSSAFGQSSSRDYPSDYQLPSSKRQRISVSNGTGSYDRDATFNQRSYVQPQNTYGWNTSQSQQLPNSGSEFTQTPLSASAAMPEFNFRYSIPETSSTSSPYVSPRSQVSSYGPQAQQMVYQQQTRYGSQTYPQGQFADIPSTSTSRIAQPVPLPRNNNPVDQLQTSAAVPYNGMSNADHRTNMPSANQSRPVGVKDEYFQYPQQMHSPEQMIRTAQSLQSRYNIPNAQSSNHLPPLHSTISNSQPLLVTSSTYNNYVPSDNRLPSQPIAQHNLHLPQEQFSGYPPSSVDLEDRRNLHEPG